MSIQRYEIMLRRDVHRRLTVDSLASCTGLHPAVIERYVEVSLIEPADWAGTSPLFDVSCVSRVRIIERLRRDLGVNLAGAAVILDLLDRLHARSRHG